MSLSLSKHERDRVLTFVGALRSSEIMDFLNIFAVTRLFWSPPMAVGSAIRLPGQPQM